MWKILVVVVLASPLCGCATTILATPTPSTSSVVLRASTPVAVEVQDFRPTPDNGDGTVAVLVEDLRQHLSASGSGGLILKVDLLEFRNFFTFGNWNGVLRLRARLVDAAGAELDAFDVQASSKESNMHGYKTARHVSQVAYDQGFADLLSQLSSSAAWAGGSAPPSTGP